MKITIEKLNEVYMRVLTDDAGIDQELSDYFKFRVPGYQFTPAYRAKIWDGFIRLFDLQRKTLYIGLFEYVQKFAEAHNYQIELKDNVCVNNNLSEQDVYDYVSALNLHGDQKPITIRDYQIDAVTTALNKERTVLLSPTGSGKSLIIYSICRWHIEQGRKVMILVPTTSLVEQLYADFEDYSWANGWSTKANVQKLYSGFSREFHKNVLISTWQSVYLQPKAWFDQFNVIVGDEAHTFKSKSLVSVMEKMSNIKYRIGTTGTIDNKKVHKLVLEGIFGPVHRVTSSKDLMDQGTLAKLNITCLVLKYQDEIRKIVKDYKYQDEIDYIISSEQRNKFIRNLAVKCKGNTLVLFNYVERHGSILYDMIKNKVHEDRKVFFIHGGTDVEDREAIRHITDKENDAIIVASFGTLSTGVNIPSIENVIFASPSKSKIRNLQSIGRGLRKKDGKTECNLYDIADDFSWKSKKNHTLNHFAERIKTYSEENFEFKIVEINI